MGAFALGKKKSDEMKSSGSDKLKRWLWLALWVVPITYISNFVYAIFSDQTGGTFGDTFGAANALFSGTALLMLVLAVTLQREELEQVREERDDTRKLLQGQEELTKAQRAALDKQVFDQSFFSLLTMINEEKARLLGTDTTLPHKTTRMMRCRDACGKLLIHNAVGSTLDKNAEFQLDLVADESFNLINMIAAEVSLLESSKAIEVDRDLYLAIIKGLVDFDLATCIAWFHASSRASNNKISLAYGVLDIRKSLASNLRDYTDQILEKNNEHA